MAAPFVHESSYIDDDVVIGEDTRVWYFCHVQAGASIGKRCNIGQNVFVGAGVRIGDGVKIQNNVSVYEGVELGDYVFCGPSCVFTNDLTPRAKFPKDKSEYKKTLVGEGATIGANATVVCGHDIGEWAMVAAGAVVTKDVPDHALVAGVPAQVVGYVCHCGKQLPEDLSCCHCGRGYRRADMGLELVAEASVV